MVNKMNLDRRIEELEKALKEIDLLISPYHDWYDITEIRRIVKEELGKIKEDYEII